MSLYALFETSDKLSQQGAACKIGKNSDGSIPTFFVARSHSSNQLYAKAVNKHYTAEYVNSLENISDEESQKVSVEVFLEGNLIGWENVTDREGNTLPFSRENARILFNELPELFVRVESFTKNLGNYLKVKEEEAVKN